MCAAASDSIPRRGSPRSSWAFGHRRLRLMPRSSERARLEGVAGRDGPGPAQPGAEPMSKLSDTQAIVLSAASQRADGNLLPLPGSLRGGAAAKVVAALLARGLAEERVLDRTVKADAALSTRLAQPRRRPRRPAADHGRRSRAPSASSRRAWRRRGAAAARRGPQRHRLSRLPRRPRQQAPQRVASAAAGQGAARAPSRRLLVGDARPAGGRHDRRDRRGDRLAAAHACAAPSPGR